MILQTRTSHHKIVSIASIGVRFINQARAGRRAPGFLKLFLCGRLYVCLCVCVRPPRLVITSGVMWQDMDPI